MGEITERPPAGVRLPRYFEQVLAQAAIIDRGELRLTLPGGRHAVVRGAAPGPVVELAIHNPEIFARIVRQGVLGFAEGYLDGDWSTPDLQALMDILYTQVGRFYRDFPGIRLVRLLERLRFWLQSNSRRQAKRNIARHYDLGNDFYSLWLDETMTYSSALFQSGQESLEAAQRRKYRSVIGALAARPDDHVLEIGCGWGGFAEYAAAEHGLKVTALTISREQHDFASRRIAQAGLADRVTVKLQDYRDEKGCYEGIASIEMFEAVGEAYWPTFFDVMRDRLLPRGKAALQTITIREERFENYRHTMDFIQKYIFPGGMLPTPSALLSQAERAGLRITGRRDFAESYSMTLRRWHETFNAQWDRVASLGFDDRFRRMWNFYLTSCAASFHSRNSDVTQLTITRPA